MQMPRVELDRYNVHITVVKEKVSYCTCRG